MKTAFAEMCDAIQASAMMVLAELVACGESEAGESSKVDWSVFPLVVTRFARKQSASAACCQVRADPE
jgi:hypothetical protein